MAKNIEKMAEDREKDLREQIDEKIVEVMIQAREWVSSLDKSKKKSESAWELFQMKYRAYSKIKSQLESYGIDTQEYENKLNKDIPHLEAAFKIK